MKENISKNRRDFLGMTLGGVAAVGAVASLYAMKRTWDPLPSVVSAGFTTADISNLKANELKIVEWRKKPVYILKRDKADGELVAGREFELNGEVYTIGVLICTHLGCIPGYNPSNKEFLCACHGGRFDNVGRNIAGTPPPRPMDIPPFKIDGTKLVLGEEGDEYKSLIEAKA